MAGRCRYAELEGLSMGVSFRLPLGGTLVWFIAGAILSTGIVVHGQEAQQSPDTSTAVHTQKDKKTAQADEDQQDQDIAPAADPQTIPPVAAGGGVPVLAVASPFTGMERSAAAPSQDAIQTTENSTEAAQAMQQTLRPITVGASQITGYPSDWTHHRVVFTDPGSEEEAIQQGRHEEWLRVVSDPRYVLNALKRHAPVQGPAAADVAGREAAQARVAEVLQAARSGAHSEAGIPVQFDTGGFRPLPPVRRRARPQAKEDWNVPLTTGTNTNGVIGDLTGGMLQPNVYPAKYNFNPNGTMSCPNDYVVYPTGLAGVTGTVTTPGTPNIIAYNNLDTGVLSGVTSCGTILEGVFDLNLLLNQNVSPNPTVMWAFNTGGAVTGSPVLSLDGSQVAYVQQTSATNTAAQLVLLKWSSPGNQVGIQLNVLGLLQLGASEMINGYEYSYGVGNIPLLSGLLSSVPSTTATSNFSTCGLLNGLGLGYQVVTAGESSTGTPGTAYACIMTLRGSGTTVSHSNPFPDYINGALYVGDDQGYLHMFTGLAFGQPGLGTGQAGSTATVTEATPLKLGSTPVGAPAYDNVSGCIFVGDAAGVLYEVNPGFTKGTLCNKGTAGQLAIVAQTAQLANGTTNGILDAPMVDSNTQAVYAFVSSSSTVGGLTAGSNAIYQFTPGFATNANPVTAQAVGTGGSALEFLDGDFDNVYYSSSNATGNLYVVGNTRVKGTPTTGGTLYRIPIVSKALQTPVALAAVNTNSNTYAYASPVMEFCNNGGSNCAVSNGKTTSGVDLIYFSDYKGPGGILGGLAQVLTNTSCEVASLLGPGGCIYGVNVSNPATASLYADYYTSWAGSGLNPCWVTSGFVVDNGDTSLLDLNALGVGSQMYFVGSNGNSDSLISSYDPCGSTKTTGNVIDAQQIGQGNLVL